MGVKIFNCSWAMEDYNKALELTMKDTDAVFVCAAGNYMENVQNTPVYPACFNIKNKVSVGAIDNSANLWELSNYGKQIDLAAPGAAIMSTVPGDYYDYMSGTSMATPFVTGVLALIKGKSHISCNNMVDRIKKSISFNESLEKKYGIKGFIDAFLALK